MFSSATKQIGDLPVISDAITLMLCGCNIIIWLFYTIKYWLVSLDDDLPCKNINSHILIPDNKQIIAIMLPQTLWQILISELQSYCFPTPKALIKLP